MYKVGDDIAGYRVQEVLGSGGMGEVYRARHPRLPRADAIKVLRSAHAEDPVVRARFEREADLLAPLTHPHLVRIYDRGVVDGQLWIGMELVPGIDASQLIKASPGGVDPRLAVAVVEAVGGALDIAHRNGVLHRDIKPANILIAPGQDPIAPEAIKVTDFGIAQALGEAGAGLTGTGTTVGTMRYCSPEQIEGRAVDSRSDIYSLAATAFELLTGSAPFSADSLQGLMTAHLLADPPYASQRNRALSPAVDSVLRAGLAKNPTHRPPTGRKFAANLRAALEGRPIPVADGNSGPVSGPFTGQFGGASNGPATGPTTPGPAFSPTPGRPLTVPGRRVPQPAARRPRYRRTGVIAGTALVLAALLGVLGGWLWGAGDDLGTPGRPDVAVTAQGVELSWDQIPGAREYIVRQDDTEIRVVQGTSTLIKGPLPGVYRYSVAARGTEAAGSSFSDQTDPVTVPQTWRHLAEAAALFPDLLPPSPVSKSGFDAMICNGTGPYVEEDDRLGFFCTKYVGDDPEGEIEYQVAVYVYPEDETPSTWDLTPPNPDRDSDFVTAQGSDVTVESGVEDGEGVAVLRFSSLDGEPRANSLVVVSVPNAKNADKALEIMKRLPI